MVTRQEIVDFANQIARLYSPEKIILFGSQARGEATTHSDVDMLVVMDYEGIRSKKGAEILTKLRPGFAVDLLLRSRTEIATRIAMDDCFVRDIVEKGVTLYDDPNSLKSG